FGSFASDGSRHQLRPLSALPPKADIASAPRNALVTSDRERRDRTRPGSRARPKRDAELRMVVTLRQAFVRVPQAIPPFLKACTHKSAFCKRGSVNVGFAPKAIELVRRREMTRMGWTGRAPAPNGSQSQFRGFRRARGAHHHALQDSRHCPHDWYR